MTNKKCPCGLLENYTHCCGRWIETEIPAPTPEALMRSRYTAYTQANIDYIQRTMRGPAALNFDPVSAKQWASAVKWLRLEVKQAYPHPTDESIAYVEFVAKFIQQGQHQHISELSEFNCIDNVWYYVNKKIG